MDTLKAMAMKRFGNFAQTTGRKYICEGDMSTIKNRAIQAIEMMPDAMVAKMIKSSPICTSQSPMGSMESLLGGKRKTRKQKRRSKARKTRKH